MKICSFENCGRKYRAKGLCSGHYNMQLSGKELKALGLRGKEKALKEKKSYAVGKSEPCSIPTCEKNARAKGYCMTHYQRIRINGDPNVNYKAKYKREPSIYLDNVKKQSGNFRRYEETEILREFFLDDLDSHRLNLNDDVFS